METTILSILNITKRNLWNRYRQQKIIIQYPCGKTQPTIITVIIILHNNVKERGVLQLITGCKIK